MKKILTALAVAALLGSGSFAMAQDAGVSVETPAVDAAVGVDASYDSLTSALSGSTSVDLAKVTEQSQVTIVLLSSLTGEAGAFDKAFAANAEGNTTLHGNVSGNAAIKAKLEAEGHTADDVVAVKSNADGSVMVYVDDRG
ncbi:hypothetical protein [Devosia faecipullorum]|uniref:hypothetical protein n=1 Tax=Devosia faecipullorum TaxID=2755039 RepID=UPI00187B3BC0|nr:hypothetical protein [Devosia faecipullorum]MBE7732479.1 hypothetical protein [Devosia faecipullorum]